VDEELADIGNQLERPSSSMRLSRAEWRSVVLTDARSDGRTSKAYVQNDLVGKPKLAHSTCQFAFIRATLINA
jgi:hypothetical protein